MEGWVANKIADSEMNEFDAAKPDVNKFAGKTNVCPTDKSPLFGYTGDDIPEDVVAMKCSHCGWWWFPGNNLQKFKKAYDAKKNYFKLWAKKSKSVMMALPIIMMLFLVVGLGVSVVNISKEQRSAVKAGTNTGGFTATYRGNGIMEVRFTSDEELQRVLFKKLGSDVWGPENAIAEGNGKYLVIFTDLKEHEVYQIQVGEKRYYFQTQ